MDLQNTYSYDIIFSMYVHTSLCSEVEVKWSEADGRSASHIIKLSLINVLGRCYIVD
jgi:hypothetical protein